MLRCNNQVERPEYKNKYVERDDFDAQIEKSMENL